MRCRVAVAGEEGRWGVGREREGRQRPCARARADARSSAGDAAVECEVGSTLAGVAPPCVCA